MISTIEHNVGAKQADKLFQRQSWTFRLDPRDREQFRQAMRRMLERYEDQSRREIEPWERERYDTGLLTAGVGFYYFEEV
jgi:hypothetical protein